MLFYLWSSSGPGSVVGIATGYGLDGPGIESRWGRDFPHLSRPALGPTQHLYNRYRVFPGGKERPERDAEPSLPSSAVVKKGYTYTSTPSMGRTACTEPQWPYKGVLYVTFYDPAPFITGNFFSKRVRQASLNTISCNPCNRRASIDVV